MLVSGSMRAEVNNCIGAFAQVGEWSMLPSQSDYSPSLGVAGGAGFQYELQAGKKYSPTHFLFDLGVGATGGMTAYRQSRNFTLVNAGQHDLQNDLFDYIYDVRDRKDSYTNVALHVPVMIGVKHDRFYMLAGIKVYANIWTLTHATATMDTYGRYSQYIGETGIGDLRNKPDYQFFTDQHKDASVKTHLNLDLDATFEIGASVGPVYNGKGFDVPKAHADYRIAAFVDYGFLDLHTQGTKDPFVMPRYENNPASADYAYKKHTMIDQLQLNDIMSTNGFAKAVNNLVVGVKFTVLFQMPGKKICPLCRDAYNTLVPRHSGRRGMQYEE